MLYEQIATIDTEEKVKWDLMMDFLKLTFYGQSHKASPNGRIDCAIQLLYIANRTLVLLLQGIRFNRPYPF